MLNKLEIHHWLFEKCALFALTFSLTNVRLFYNIWIWKQVGHTVFSINSWYNSVFITWLYPSVLFYLSPPFIMFHNCTLESHVVISYFESISQLHNKLWLSYMGYIYILGCCRRPMKFDFLSNYAYLLFGTVFRPLEHKYEVSKIFIKILLTRWGLFGTHFVKKNWHFWH